VDACVHRDGGLGTTVDTILICAVTALTSSQLI
jgi:hypothetical protein